MKRNGNNRVMMASKAQMPRGWRLVRLGDVAEVAFSGVDKRTIEGEFPVKLCNYTDVFYNRRIQAGMDFMPATATQSELKRWALKQGDVLFTKDSETADEIGIPAFVADDLTDVLCGYHLGLARPSQATVNGSFLARTLASRTSAQEFGRIANGVTRFGLTLEATRSIPILLPPLREQRAIATVLDSIDDAIERAEAVIAATEQLRDSLLYQLLTRGIPGWHTEWKEVPGLGTIPVGWEVVRLGDVAQAERGKFAHRPRNEPRFYGGDIPFIQTGDVVRANGRIKEHSQTLNDLGLSISRLFPARTIIVTIAANIGETAIADYPVAFPDSLVGVIPHGIDTKFLE
jgi:type I restriction enzyme S subunit